MIRANTMRSLDVTFTKDNKVALPREALLSILKELLEWDPSNYELAVLFVAVRDGKRVAEVEKEIEEETGYLMGSEVMKKRLLEAMSRKEGIPYEAIREKFGI